MKGLVYHGDEVLKWEEVQDVAPDDNEVKIKVKAAGICGSDVHGYQGITGRRIPPMIMGHEFSGVISEVGKSVKNLRPGDRVTAYPMDFCGMCLSCRNGKMQFCPDKKQFGVLTVNGAFAEFLCVPEKVCYKLHDDISYSAGSMVEPLAVAFRGVAHAGDIEGKNILVVGSGTIGLLITACAKVKNPAKIIVTDLSDTRLNVAKRMGAEITINPLNSEVKEAIMDNTEGQGVDISFEAVGNTPACVQSLENLKQGGTSIWLGQGKKTVEIGMLDIVTRELSVSGSFTYGLEDFKSAVEMLNNGSIDPEPIISEEVPMGQAAQWFEKLKRPEELVKVILKEEE
ncbi:MAG: alcohol dehydrogenase catalytic domain-containing protein [Desulfobacterales bacterium]